MAKVMQSSFITSCCHNDLFFLQMGQVNALILPVQKYRTDRTLLHTGILMWCRAVLCVQAILMLSPFSSPIYLFPLLCSFLTYGIMLCCKIKSEINKLFLNNSYVTVFFVLSDSPVTLFANHVCLHTFLHKCSNVDWLCVPYVCI